MRAARGAGGCVARSRSSRTPPPRIRKADPLRRAVPARRRRRHQRAHPRRRARHRSSARRWWWTTARARPACIGTDLVSKAPPDGYTLLLGPITLAFNAALYRKLPYDALRDFAPISLVADQPNILVAHPSLPAKSFKEFIALARAQPGKLTYGSAGVGTGTHLAMELLCLSQKIELVHVPYKGVGPALTALLGNEVSALLSTFASALPHVKSERLRAFGVTSAQRAPTLPDVPTIAESGVPGYEYSDLVRAGRARRARRARSSRS